MECQGQPVKNDYRGREKTEHVSEPDERARKRQRVEPSVRTMDRPEKPHGKDCAPRIRPCSRPELPGIDHQAPGKKHQDAPREVEGKERPYDAVRRVTKPMPPPHVVWQYGVIER